MKADKGYYYDQYAWAVWFIILMCLGFAYRVFEHELLLVFGMICTIFTVDACFRIKIWPNV